MYLPCGNSKCNENREYWYMYFKSLILKKIPELAKEAKKAPIHD